MDNLKKTSQRTSIGQLQWAFRQLCHAVTCVCRHVSRFGLAYGFLGGVISGIGIVFAVIWYGFLSYPLPWKVINPQNPRFQMTEFKFTDYSSDRELNAALIHMFPAGTDKSTVDRVLLNQAGARIEKAVRRPKTPDAPEDTRYYYTFENVRSILYTALIPASGADFSWKVTILYDENDHLKQIRVI